MTDERIERYSTEVITRFSDLEKFADAWDRLNEKSNQHKIFNQFHYHELNWKRWKSSWRHRLNVFLVFDDSGNMVMAAPLVRRYDIFGTFSLYWLSSMTPLYDDILVDSACDMEVFGTLFAQYLSSLRTCRKIKIDFVREDSNLYRLLLAAGYNCEDRTFASSVSVGDFSSWHDYLAGKTTNFRQQYNNFRNRIERNGGYQIEVLQSEKDIIPELENIFAIKRAWVRKRTDLDGWIIPQESEDWFVDFVKSEIRADQANIVRLSCGKGWLASALFFKCGNKLILSKFANSDLMPRASPGRMICSETVKYAIEHGFDTVDFMIGRDHWKDRFATEQVRVLKCRQSILNK